MKDRKKRESDEAVDEDQHDGEARAEHELRQRIAQPVPAAGAGLGRSVPWVVPPRRTGRADVRPPASSVLLRQLDGADHLLDGGLRVVLAVEVRGDHVVDRVLHRRRVGVAVRHRAEEVARLRRRLELLDRPSGRRRRSSATGNVGARRHRALHLVEGDLELRRHDRLGQRRLLGLDRVALLEHRRTRRS